MQKILRRNSKGELKLHGYMRRKYKPAIVGITFFLYTLTFFLTTSITYLKAG